MLELKSLSRNFGAIKVINELDLSVEQGEVLGILGPNGAGKSTLFNLINGNLRPSAGTIVYDGKDITKLNTWTRCRMGVGRTFQIPKPFSNLSVFENALISAVHGGRLSIAKARPVAIEALALTEMESKAEVLAGDLSLLDLKRLELSKALAIQPRLLLLDEIAGGLTDAECDILLSIIRKVHGQGTTVIWIEHVIHALCKVASRLVVLGEGKIIASGTPDEVLANERVHEIYLGT